ncbi:hypothetical protein IW262DRAFT_1257869, partial [Armillaria fumosa]
SGNFGEYITIKLDPIASLQSLNDEEVTKACSALETKTYVACATYLYSLHFPGVDWISVGLHLVSQGLPDPGPYGFTASDMSVPIYPATAHPLSRPSVKPGAPLPWPDCYAITHHWPLQDAASKTILLLVILGQTRRINWIAMIKSFPRNIFDRIPGAEKSMLKRRGRAKGLRKSLRLCQTMPELNCVSHPLRRQHKMLKADIAHRRCSGSSF